MTPEVIATLAVAILGLLGSIYAALSNRKTAAMQSTDEIAIAANSLIEPLNKRIQDLEAENRELREGQRLIKTEKTALQAQVHHLQIALDDTRREYEKRISALEASHEKETTALNNKIAGLRMREGKLQRELDTYKKRLNRIKGELDTGPLGE